MNELQDILDLCKLNIMEENIKDVEETATASIQETQSFKDAIKFGKQKVANRIINSQKPASKTVLARNQEMQSEIEDIAKRAVEGE